VHFWFPLFSRFPSVPVLELDAEWRPLLRRLREAWRETELLRHGNRIRHDGVFEDFAVTNGADVDLRPLDVIARAGASETSVVVENLDQS